MKRKDLESMGIEKENIDKIMDWNGADIEAEKPRRLPRKGSVIITRPNSIQQPVSWIS